jgi:hypothetical protein
VVGRTKPYTLVITFWRDEQETARRFARDGEQAAILVANLMIELGELQNNDRLTVTEATDDLPEVSHASHYS